MVPDLEATIYNIVWLAGEHVMRLDSLVFILGDTVPLIDDSRDGRLGNRCMKHGQI